MSGHSKWETTKRQKAVVDAKRGAVFTKLGNMIAIAARKGTDATGDKAVATRVWGASFISDISTRFGV
jgi:transcriptional/translational regulatory protein YebC/TACO1